MVLPKKSNDETQSEHVLVGALDRLGSFYNCQTNYVDKVNMGLYKYYVILILGFLQGPPPPHSEAIH